MRPKQLLLPTLLLLVLGGLFGLYLYVRPIFQTASTARSPKPKEFLYHFAVVTPESDSFYWRSFERGAFAYARQNNIALEFRAPHFTNIKEQVHYLEFVVLSKVDGIITSVPEEGLFFPLIKQASDWGIPVVTLDTLRNPPSKYVQYVGLDPYEFGKKAGDALAKACHGQANIAVLIGPLRSSPSYEQLIRGLSLSISDHPAMHLSLILDSNNGTISAEEQTYNILMHHPEVDTIFCTNAEDTEGATQVVIDLNRVNSTTIVGSGLTPEIARYISRGVIYGTVSVDPFNVGSRSIAALQALKEGIPLVFNTEISVITQDNLERLSKDYLMNGTELQ